MKRSTRVDKPQRGEQEPFSRQLANERKERRRLNEDCKARVDTVEKSAQAKINEADDEKETALAGEIDVRYELEKYLEQHRDFARVAPILRSRSFFRRLWWGIRFAVWGVFGYEAEVEPRSACCNAEIEALGALADGSMCRCMKCGREYLEQVSPSAGSLAHQDWYMSER